MNGHIEASLEFAHWWQSHGGSISSENSAAIERLQRRLVKQDLGFLKTIEAGVPDAVLIYADWLEERGDAHCAKICRTVANSKKPQALLCQLLKYQRLTSNESAADA